MSRRKVSLVVVPSHHKRISFIRIHPIFILIIIIFILGGVGGFFISFNSLTLNIVEANQKRYLVHQNEKLNSTIRSMHESIFLLKNKLDTLDRKRYSIEMMAGEKRAGPSAMAVSNYAFIDSMKTADLLEYIRVMHQLYTSFADRVRENPSYLEDVPVIAPILAPHIYGARFGVMRDPFTGRRKWHYGLDFSAPLNTPIIAPASGMVTAVENSAEWGVTMKIDHLFGFSSRYAHCAKILVAKGKKVKKGDVIATVGATGLSTGPHLHYEIIYNGRPVDPELYIFPDSTNTREFVSASR